MLVDLDVCSIGILDFNIVPGIDIYFFDPRSENIFRQKRKFSHFVLKTPLVDEDVGVAASIRIVNAQKLKKEDFLKSRSFQHGDTDVFREMSENSGRGIIQNHSRNVQHAAYHYSLR